MVMYIYGLFEPETMQLRYIGKTTDPYKRENEHCNRKGKAPKDFWIEGLKAKGQEPFFYIIEECDDDNCLVMERYLIKKYNHKRNRLLNVRTSDSWGPEIEMLIDRGNFYKKLIDGDYCPVVQFENGEIHRVYLNKRTKKPRYYLLKDYYIKWDLKENCSVYNTPVDQLPDLPKRFNYPYYKPLMF